MVCEGRGQGRKGWVARVRKNGRGRDREELKERRS